MKKGEGKNQENFATSIKKEEEVEIRIAFHEGKGTGCVWSEIIVGITVAVSLGNWETVEHYLLRYPSVLLRKVPQSITKLHGTLLWGHCGDQQMSSEKRNQGASNKWMQDQAKHRKCFLYI